LNTAYPKAVLELRGNPYPPLPGPYNRNSNPALLHNILLEEARKDYFRKQTRIQQRVEREVPEDDDGVLRPESPTQQQSPPVEPQAAEIK
jgi:hypothetical protein